MQAQLSALSGRREAPSRATTQVGVGTPVSDPDAPRIERLITGLRASIVSSAVIGTACYLLLPDKVMDTVGPLLAFGVFLFVIARIHRILGGPWQRAVLVVGHALTGRERPPYR